MFSLPPAPSFTMEGLAGYEFGPLNQKDLDVYYIVAEQGHDTFQISRRISRLYYVLAGSGYFTINNQKFDVEPGILVEVPPRVEYSYSGTMRLICFATPRWFNGNDTTTKWNPDVAHGDFICAPDRGSWLSGLVRFKLLGKSPIGGYLRVNQKLWKNLPPSLATLKIVRAYGALLQWLARMQGIRAQAFGTFFLRNRPELELIRHLLDQKISEATLRVAVLGCSTGAEAYSVAWRIGSARPDLKLSLHAVDISKHAVEFAKRGIYPLTTSELTGTAMLERMTSVEAEELFDRDGDAMVVKSWARKAIDWHVADVRRPEIVEALGSQDIVVANNFLCHMSASEAESCLRNIGRLVTPGGYLFVSGIDLAVRAKVAREMGWKPVTDLLKEIHEGDSSLRMGWPFKYWGLEPFDDNRPDWMIRYASVFQISDNLDPGSSWKHDGDAVQPLRGSG
jgi:chemotaxis methyl-accepting protein methylase/mannose-6-phosphate isomerase-like protein (cupin superfamily)